LQTTNDKITLGGGCFWCIEAVFKQLKGVENVVSGYSGGTVKNPSYKEVCTGNTGHAEVVQITYNPQIISLEKILEVFFTVHDPTQLNRQGNDIGTQYRSVIFYHNDAQKQKAEEIINTLNEKKVFDNPIVTAVEPYKNFYPAENYHKDYFELHGEEPYCKLVIKPKLDKFKKAYKEFLKD
jgi:methionine-S-sulfoxide reductase